MGYLLFGLPWRNSGGVWLGENGGGFWLGRKRRDIFDEGITIIDDFSQGLASFFSEGKITENIGIYPL